MTNNGVGDDVNDSAYWAQLTPLQEQITEDERHELALAFPNIPTTNPPKSLWRVPLGHFSTHDFNHGGGPPDCEPKAGGGQLCPDFDGQLAGGSDSPKKGSCVECGSVIDVETQSLGESLEVMGTPFTLNYRSANTFGYLPSRTVNVQFSATHHSQLKYNQLTLVTPSGSFQLQRPSPAQASITWDGLDRAGRRVQGSELATIMAGAVYPGVYRNTGRFGSSASNTSISGGYAGSDPTQIPDVIFARTFTKMLTAWSAESLGLGGWQLDVHHVYDPEAKILHMGDGRLRKVDAAGSVIAFVAGNGTSQSAADGASATQTGFSYNQSWPSIAVAPNGDIYMTVSPLAQSGNGVVAVRRIDARTGNIYTVAGGGGSTLDGVTPTCATGQASATCAALESPLHGVAIGADGSVYFSTNNRIRKVDSAGRTITTVAGTGQSATADSGTIGCAAPGCVAKNATLSGVTDIAVANDGSVYIGSGSGYVYRVDTGGIISVVAGNGTLGSCSNTVVATSTPLASFLPSLAATNDGAVWIGGGFRVMRVDPNGSVKCFTSPETNIMLAASPDSSVYYTHNGGGTTSKPVAIEKLNIDGTSAIVVGGNGNGSVVAGGLASQTKLGNGTAIAVAPDGDVVFMTAPGNESFRIYRATPPSAPTTVAGCTLRIPSEDGGQYYCFDQRGRHLSTVNAITGATQYSFVYYTDGRIHTITDGENDVTTFTYASGLVTITGPFGQQTKIGIDTTTNFATYIRDALSHDTSLTHDANGLLHRLIDRNGKTHTFDYDEMGRLKLDADQSGGAQTFVREFLTGTNGSGQPTVGYQVSRFTAGGTRKTYGITFDPNGLENRLFGLANGLQESSTLDLTGAQTVSSADGTQLASSGMTLDPSWPAFQNFPGTQVTTLPSGLQRTVTTTRLATRGDTSLLSASETVSVNSEPVLKTDYDGSLRTYTITTPEGRTRSIGVDSFGRVVTASVPNKLAADGITTVNGVATANFSYDHGRLSGVLQGSRQTSVGFYPAASSTPGYANTVTSSGSSVNQVVTLVPDNGGRTLSFTIGTGSDTSTTGFSWTGIGDLSALTPPGKSAHAFGYTDANLRQSYTPPSVGGDVLDPVTRYFFNVDHALEYVQAPGNSNLDYVYETSTGRLVQLISGSIVSGGVAVSGVNTAFTYYGSTPYNSTTCPGCAPGRLKTATQDATTVTFSYDGPLKTKEEWSASSSAVNGSVAWTYNNDFRPATETVTAPVGGPSPVYYGYDNDGLLTCASETSFTTCVASASTMKLDRSITTGAVTGSTVGSFSDSYSFNTYGEIGGYTAKYGANALYSVIYDDGTASGSRDGFGRVLKKVETVNGTNSIYLYQYDSVGRLSQVTQNGSVVRQYRYDPNGNRLTFAPTALPNPPPVIAYDPQDRLTSYNNGATTYTYSADGQLRTRSTGGAVDEFTYDALGNLRAVLLGNGARIGYSIDGLGRRIQKTVNGVVTKRWLYRNGLNPIAELSGGGQLIARFVYASRPNVPDLMIMASSEVRRIISDQLGSPRLVIGATGGIVQQMNHDDFGNVTQDTNPGFQPFGFAGGIYDPDTKLVRFGVRDYDPATGRWVSKDPMLFDGGQANLYVYAGNDPVNVVDPRGLWGFAAGVGGEFGASWTGVWGGSGGLYVDITGGSIGTYESVSGSLGLGVVASSGPQVSGFSDLGSFQGWGIGAEVDTPWAAGMATTPLTSPGSGLVLTGSGPGFAVYSGIPVGYIWTQEIFNWRSAWSWIVGSKARAMPPMCPK